MKTADKVINILGKPINFDVLLASLLTSSIILLINFLPTKYIQKLHLENFLDKYDYIILIVFFVSLFLIIIHFSAKMQNNKKDKEFKEIYEKNQKHMFNDPQAMKILLELYQNHPNSVYLPLDNQKVKLLEQYGLITKATGQAFVNLWEPRFPYILQPIAEDKLKQLEKSNKNN